MSGVLLDICEMSHVCSVTLPFTFTQISSGAMGVANESLSNNCCIVFALGRTFLVLYSLCTLCFKLHKLSVKFKLKIASSKIFRIKKNNMIQAIT